MKYQEEFELIIYLGMWCIIVYILYTYNMLDFKHYTDCMFNPHTNATGIMNFDCEEIFP